MTFFIENKTNMNQTLVVPTQRKEILRKKSKAGSIMLPDCKQYYEATPSGAVVKNLPIKAEDAKDKCSVPEWRRCPGEGNGYPLQYSCLENPVDRGAWWATVHGVANTTDPLSTYACKNQPYSTGAETRVDQQERTEVLRDNPTQIWSTNV